MGTVASGTVMGGAEAGAGAGAVGTVASGTVMGAAGTGAGVGVSPGTWVGGTGKSGAGGG